MQMCEDEAPRVPGYEPVTWLGAGGSAVVWAMRASSGEDVAVKVFHPEAGMSGRAEWKALQRFRSDHVVAVRELTSTEDGRAALVMDLCGGGTLEAVVRGRGGLTVGEVTTALAPIVAVVSRMHAEGVVHGDLSPRNVLFTPSGKPLLADLGCMRDVGDRSASSWCTEGFTAPEVIDGQAVDPASDVYSLAALAWFALTAEPPGLPALRPHLVDVRPDVPREMAEAITSGLAMTPTARIEGEQLAEVLSNASAAVAVPVAKVRPGSKVGITRRRRSAAVKRQRGPRHRAEVPSRWRTRLAVSAGVCVSLGLLAAAAFWPTPPRRASGGAPVAASPSASPRPQRPRTSSPPPATQAPPSPDRTSVSVALPRRVEIESLLTCRASAWNARSVFTLRGCLAPHSQALHDDTLRLEEAAAQGVRYSGLTYRVQAVESLTMQEGQATARVVIAQSGYLVHGTGSTRRMPAEQHHVRLTFTGSSGAWQLASWNVV